MIPQSSEHFDNTSHDLDEKERSSETPCNEPFNA